MRELEEDYSDLNSQLPLSATLEDHPQTSGCNRKSPTAYAGPRPRALFRERIGPWHDRLKAIPVWTGLLNQFTGTQAIGLPLKGTSMR